MPFTNPRGAALPWRSNLGPFAMLVVLSTFPDPETARRVCRVLVEEACVACANLIPRIESIYAWQGEIRHEDEVLALMKLPSEGFAHLENRLSELHPYEVPEIVALRPEAVNERYSAWVMESGTSAAG